MRHDRLPAVRGTSLLARKRVQLAGTLLIVAFLPWLMRGPLLPGKMLEPASINTLAANTWAVLIAFWMRLSIEVYPGIRRSSIILPITLTSHAIPLTLFVLTRAPYDRIGLAVAFILHVAWLYALYLYTQHRVRRRFAVVPFGRIARLAH